MSDENKGIKEKIQRDMRKLRRSGAGQESDEEVDETSNFHFFQSWML